MLYKRTIKGDIADSGLLLYSMIIIICAKVVLMIGMRPFIFNDQNIPTTCVHQSPDGWLPESSTQMRLSTECDGVSYFL